MFKLTDAEFQQFCDLILEQSGIAFEEKKRYFVEKRIEKCFKETSFMSVKDYYRALKYGGSKEELMQLLEALTTNETYFYRHVSQIESFAEEAVPLILEERRKQNKHQLNIWSAACSSGAEIYTIGILLKETIPDINKWKINLLGTDIDRKIIKIAKDAIYDKRAVKDVPPHILKKYFTLLSDGRYQLNSSITSMVKFEHVNLVDRIAMKKYQEQDCIFCRNVLIYFSDEAKRQVVHSLYQSLNKNGFIFLGHAESVGRITSAFRLKKFKKSLSYQK